MGVSPFRQSHVLRRKNVIARLRFPLMTLLELTVQWLIALDFFEQKTEFEYAISREYLDGVSPDVRFHPWSFRFRQYSF